jgi:hypothetical protein
MTCGIYRITNTIDNKSYIGSSINIEKRWREHNNSLLRGQHHSSHLQRAYNKYGLDAFGFLLVEETSRDLLLEREKYWIEFYNAGDSFSGYNMYKNPLLPGYPRGETPNSIRDLHAEDRLVSFIAPDGTVFTGIKNVTRFSKEHGLSPVSMNLVASGKRTVSQGWTKLGNEQGIATSGSRKRRPGSMNIDVTDANGNIFHISNLQQFCEERSLNYTPIHNMIRGLSKTSFGFKLLGN